MAVLTLSGKQVHTNGELPPVGSVAPEFFLTNKALEDISLKEFAGKKLLLNIVPSLDTKTCAVSTRKFNESFEGREDAVALVISADLPFTQKRFCTIDDITNVTALSMMKNRQFAQDYGVLMTDGPLIGLCARAVVVIDEDGRVIHSPLVSEIADEPDYVAALQALN